MARIKTFLLTCVLTLLVAACGGGGDSGAGTAPGQTDTTPPSAPAGLVAMTVGASVVNLTWSASTDNVGVIGYIIRRDNVEIGTSATSDYADTGLSSGTTYTYTVTARDAAGNASPDSSSVSATTADTIAPSIPTGLVATVAGGSAVNLTWTASTDNIGVIDYIVKRNGAPVGTSLTPSYSDAGLSSATPYTYTVSARDAASNVSAESATASATILDTSPPSTPAGLVATVTGATTINLTWSVSTDNVAVTGYSVRRNGVEVGTPATPGFADTGLSVATPYTYTVTARDAAGNVSGSSTSASATILDTSPPSTPAGLVATVTGATTINLTWSASTDNVGVTGYSVKRNGVEVGTPATPGFADTGLSVATPYTYTVTARDAASNVSAESATASATILDTSPPSTPAGLVATVTGATTINLTWSASTDNVGVTGYSVKRNGVEVGTPATPGFADTGLSVATPYTYTVTARDAASNVSAESATASATILDTSPPSTPAGLVATVTGATTINLTWSASTDNVGVTGYSVKRNGVEVGTPATPGFADTGLSVATPYTYTVTARDAAGNVSGSSTSASATILDTSPPSTPAGLVATVTGATTINLTWSASTDNVGVTGYSVRRNGVEVGTPVTPSYTDSGLLSGSTNNYTVAARDAANNVSFESTIVSATTTDTIAPTTPTGLAAIAAGEKTINLTWSASTDNVGVTGYIVKRGTQIVGTPTTTSFADATGLLPGLTYSYTVAARDAVGNASPESLSVSATTADTTPPSVPASLMTNAVGETTINLTWTASTDNVGVTGYIVKRNGTQVGITVTPSFADSGLSAVTTYSYTIAARDAVGNLSSESVIVSATTADTTPPSTPAGLLATAAGSAAVNLTWSVSTDNVAVTGYIVKRNGAQVGTSSSPAYADTGLSAATTYNYTVQARDAAGNVSPDSTSVSATTTSSADTTPPSTPTGLVATVAGPTTISLSWTASTDNVGVTSYVVSRNGSQVGTSTTPGHADSGLTAGTTFTYTVAARDAAGNVSASSGSASATIPDTSAPSVPVGLVASAAGATTINLTWSASSDNVGVTGYIVKRNGTQVGTPASTSFADTGLLSGLTYSYTVSARDAVNNVSSDSASASATTGDTTPPSTPTGVVAIAAAGGTTVNLTWTASTDNIGVTGYIVKRNGTQVGTSVAPSYADLGLASATTYTYTIAARDAANNVSSDSAIASATTGDTTPPSVPTGLVATPSGATTVNLSWSASTDNIGVTGYIVRRNGAQIATTTATSYADTGLSSSTAYTYTVAARDAANNVSANSASASATPIDTIAPSTPAGLVATAAVGAATINLTWSASTDNVGVTGYIVKRNGVQVGTSGTTSYSDTGLTSSTTYSYTVAARDAAVNISPDSASVSAKTADTTPPSMPAGLVATAAAGAATINLTWSASTDNVAVTGYIVKRNGLQVATPGTTSYSDTGLAAATTYNYTVAARDAAGNVSSESAIASATTANTVFPLHTEAGKRYLIDAAGKPFLLHADAAWSLTVQLTSADTAQYLEDRRVKGFNAVLVNLIEHAYANNPPRNAAGDAPFTTAGNYATPNEAYFAHVEDMLNIAQSKGILVLLTPSYMGAGGGSEGWYQEMSNNGAAKLRSYGQYLATRFAGHDNILWVHGGDYNPPDKSLLRAIALGLRDIDVTGRWQHTFHGSRGTSALSFLDPGVDTWLTVNTIYTDELTVISNAFTEYNRSTMPYFLIEARYEGEGASGLGVRQQAYQAVLSGASGQTMGNKPIWLFGSGWQSALNSAGSRTMARLRSLLEAHAWTLLQPDTANTFLTGGQGSGGTRAPAALASDGSFGLIYSSSGNALTVNLARLAGPRVSAKWYDPGNGALATVSGSPFAASGGNRSFTPPGNNSEGDSDWVLVLESTP